MRGGGGKLRHRKKTVISKAEVPIVPPTLHPTPSPFLNSYINKVISAQFQRELHYTPFEQATKYFYLKSCFSAVINNFSRHQFQTREDGQGDGRWSQEKLSQCLSMPKIVDPIKILQRKLFVSLFFSPSKQIIQEGFSFLGYCTLSL